MKTLSVYNKIVLALIAVALSLSGATANSRAAGITSAWSNEFAEFEQHVDYVAELVMEQSSLPGVNAVASWVVRELPKGLSDKDTSILAAGLAYKAVTGLRNHPGSVSRESIFSLVTNPLSGESQARLAFYNQAYFQRTLVETKTRMERDQEYAQTIKQIMSSRAFSRTSVKFLPPIAPIIIIIIIILVLLPFTAS